MDVNQKFSIPNEIQELLDSTAPFEYNHDFRHRDEIFSITANWEADDDQDDMVNFNSIDLDQFISLLKNRFIDPQSRQNNSPTIRQFFVFMVKHPAVRAHGYVIGPKREDYRVSIEGLFVAPDDVTAELRDAFLDFCATADQLDPGSMLYSWWD